MDAVINDFIHLLRRHSMRVSPAESLDALRALRVVGLGEREVVRDTLRATLIKSTEDIAAFDRRFELYFGLHRPAEPRPVDLGLPHDHGGEIARVELGEDLESESAEGDDHPHSHEAPEATNRLEQHFAGDQAALRPLGVGELEADGPAGPVAIAGEPQSGPGDGQSLTSVADDSTGASQLVVISGTLLIVGLALFALRWTSRRFGG